MALLPGFVAAEPRQAGGGDRCGEGHSRDGTDSADDLRLAGAGAAASQYKQALAEDRAVWAQARCGIVSKVRRKAKI